MPLVNFRLMTSTRRQFVSGCAAAVAGAYALPAYASSGPSVKFPSTARDRVAVACYPFREFIAGGHHKAGNPAIEFKDFAGHVVERFNVHRIEPWSALFASTGAAYLASFRSAAEKAGAGFANIAADGKHSAYAADPAERAQAVAFGKQWIDVAAAIGSPSIRTNVAEAKDAKPDAPRLAESLKQVAEYGAKKNVVIHLENDNPLSEDPFFLVSVIEKVGSPWLHALPDFGNTVQERDADYAYRAIDALFAHAYGICHVKDGEGSAPGKVTRVDMPRTFAILKKHGYKGYCSIEYDTDGGEPYSGTAQLVEATVRYL
jgi:sugar phosphate isomerase/epimerase